MSNQLTIWKSVNHNSRKQGRVRERKLEQFISTLEKLLCITFTCVRTKIEPLTVAGVSGCNRSRANLCWWGRQQVSSRRLRVILVHAFLVPPYKSYCTYLPIDVMCTLTVLTFYPILDFFRLAVFCIQVLEYGAMRQFDCLTAMMRWSDALGIQVGQLMKREK